MTFTKLNPSQLKQFASVPQCLDNQWAPESFIHRMRDEGVSRASLEGEIKPLVKSGFVRSLLQSEQVIVNRAFFHNCPTLIDLYSGSGERSDLEHMLSSSDIVMYLMNESSPLGGATFDVNEDPSKVESWQSLCESADIHCVKLSWDEQRNERKIEQLLGRRFQEVTTSLEYGNAKQYCLDFGLKTDAEHAVAFEDKLQELSDFSVTQFRDKKRADQKNGRARNVTSYVSRADLYREFVCPENAASYLGYVDKSKPFSAEIKQLIDLHYNIGLPDALDRFSVTAAGTIGRSVLQEIQFSGQNARRISPDQLGKAIADIGFNLAPQSFEPIALSQLTLSQVRSLRNDPLFANYIRVVKKVIPNNNGSLLSSALLTNPNESLKELSEAYIELIKEGGKRALTKPVSDGDWRPTVDLIVSFVGTGLKIVTGIEGTFFDDPSLLDVALGGGPVPFLVEFQLGRERRKAAGDELDAAFLLKVPLLKGKTEDALDAFTSISNAIRENGRYKEETKGAYPLSNRRQGGHEPRDLEDDNEYD